MSLIKQIKQDQLAARLGTKNPHAASLLTTLIGEAEMVGKNAGNRESTDAEVVAVIKKFIKNIDETLEVLKFSSDGKVANLFEEKRVLEEYLPRQLSEYELKAIAVARSNMPDYMKYLKENHAGQYDGKLASQVARAVYK